MTHKLLLADDSVTIQRVIELTFADEDVEVTAVGDGQMAIDRLDVDPPDIILADIDMPKRDGYEVAAYVKSRPKLAHIPVVLLTGAFEPIDQARAAAAGSSDVLAKPFEPQMVINRVKELLGKKRMDDEQPYASSNAASQAAEPPMNDPPPNREPGAEGQSVSLDDYFDQLDAAFSSLQPGPPQSDGSDEVDWPVDPPDTRPVVTVPTFSAPPVTMVPLAPGAYVAPAAPIAPITPAAPTHTSEHAPAPPALPAAAFASVAPAAPVAPVLPIALVAPVPPISPKPSSNPFANLTAAKAEAAGRPPAPVISDEVIEEVVSRVLQRMTDRIVRETVTDVVSQTAERLVQEEIERIRSGS
jgi:CheY-like chemotaxis protein